MYKMLEPIDFAVFSREFDGYKAFVRGESIDDYPYEAESFESDNWKYGWRKAEHDFSLRGVR